MAHDPKVYTIVTFPLRRDKLAEFKKLFPRYGDVSKVLRLLVDRVVDGRIKVKP